METTIKDTIQFQEFRLWTKDDTTAYCLLAVWLANNYPETYFQTKNNLQIPCHLYSIFLGESTKARKSTILSLVKGTNRIPFGSMEGLAQLPDGTVGYMEIDEIQKTMFPAIDSKGLGNPTGWLCKVYDFGDSFQKITKDHNKTKSVESLTGEKKVNISICAAGIKTLFFGNLPSEFRDSGLLWRFLFVDIENKIKIYKPSQYYFSDDIKIKITPIPQPKLDFDFNSDFKMQVSEKEIYKYIDEQIPDETAHGERSINSFLRIARLFAITKNNTLDQDCLDSALLVVNSSIEYLQRSFKDENPAEVFITDYLKTKTEVSHRNLYRAFLNSGKTKEQWQDSLYSLLGLDKYGRINEAFIPKISARIKPNKVKYYSYIKEQDEEDVPETEDVEDPLDTIKALCIETKNPEFINQSQAISIKKLTYEDGEVRKYPNGKWKDIPLKKVSELEPIIDTIPVLLSQHDGSPKTKEVDQTYIGVKLSLDKYFYIDIDGDNHLQNGLQEIQKYLSLEDIKNTYCEISKSGKGYHLVYLKPQGVDIYSRNKGGVEVKTNHLMNRKIGAFHNGKEPILPPQSIIDFCSNKEKIDNEIIGEAKSHEQDFLNGVRNTIRLKNSSSVLHFVQTDGVVDYLDVEYSGSRHIACLSIAAFLSHKGLTHWEDDLKAWFLYVKPKAELEFKGILRDARGYAKK